MKTYKIAAIPGDGIGTEVVSAGLQVQEFPWGSDYYLTQGRMMAEDGLDQ